MRKDILTILKEDLAFKGLHKEVLENDIDWLIDKLNDLSDNYARMSAGYLLDGKIKKAKLYAQLYQMVNNLILDISVALDTGETEHLEEIKSLLPDRPEPSDELPF